MPDGDEGQAGEDSRKLDYAIIVGVTRYPELMRDGKPADLQGSINDAKKVRAWIESDEGGGVPSANVEYVIRADATADGTPDPTRDTVVAAFVKMYRRCWPYGPAGPPQVPTGRRLYVYVSGHGLAADLDHGALLCSNSSVHLYSTVAPYASIGAFRKAGFFKEFVVWFDGCMDFPGLEPESINYVPRPGNDTNSPGPVFTAYAARPRFKTIECQDDKGIMGGVFTRTLLAGLDGGAADPDTGVIDCHSLEKYLYNAMPKYFPDSAKRDVTIDQQPSVTPRPGMIFGTKKKVVKTTPAILRFDAAYNGADARVWGRKAGIRQSLSLLETLRIEDGKVELALPNGVYAVDVPQHGLRSGFEITGGVATMLSPN